MNAIPMEITDDRKTTIVIEGVEYDLVFNATAAKIICDGYGSVKDFMSKIEEGAQTGFDRESVNLNVWLTTLLVNQGIAIYNRRNPGDQRKPFTEDDIELLTCPGDWSRAFIALRKGSARYIESEADPSKNAEVG